MLPILKSSNGDPVCHLVLSGIYEDMGEEPQKKSGIRLSY